MMTVLSVLYIAYRLIEEQFEEKGVVAFWVVLLVLLAIIGA